MTSEPGFMGSLGEYNTVFANTMRGRKKMKGFGKDHCSLYFHGKLEQMLGYDIPIWLTGKVTIEPYQQCIVYDKNGVMRYDAYIVMIWDERNNRWLGYIVLPGEALNTMRNLMGEAYANV